jgi:hypothetical protein
LFISTSGVEISLRRTASKLQCEVDTDHDHLRFYMTIQATSEKTTTNRTGTHAPS